MNVLVGTPCGGGVVSTQYLMSYVSMLGLCIQNKITPILYMLSQESLLPRGRNHMAEVCMRNKYDKLFFIDADSGWNAEQFVKICHSPFPICAGLVPLKVYPIVYNFVPFKEDDKFFTNNLRTPEATYRMRMHYNMSEIPVAFTGTAFLCIDSQVLYKLSETCQPYQYPDPFTGETTTHWDFFGGGPMFDTYYSEDWAFCEKARRAGYDVRVNFDIQINHVGTHVYRVNPKLAVDMAPEIYRPLLYRIANARPNQLVEIEDLVKDIVKDEQMIINQTIVHAPQASVAKYDNTNPN